MRHVQENQALYPGNRQPMPLASDGQHDQNRKDALRGIQSGHTHKVTGEPLHRDEKQLAMLHNDNHATTTTVKRLPESESRQEGGMASDLKRIMEESGAKGQLRANPGWRPLSPNQRIAHEAPARLGSESRNPPDANAAPPKKQKPKADPRVKEEEERRKAEGYIPTTASGTTLRHRKGQLPPPEPIKKDKKPKPKDESETNLIKGHQLPAGHRWTPNKTGASHAGAPVPNKDSENRYPPRPQNIDAHRNRDKTTRPLTPPADANPGKKSEKEKFDENLAKFNQDHPMVKRPPHKAKVHEAPAQLQTPPSPPSAARGSSGRQSNTNAEAGPSNSKPKAFKPPKKGGKD
ncbi:hypothetical protein CVT24_001182 [Panaeolus cyanescens]|uniref:Uncharacterized protein n=1 Tax=Panaeolus cyanescens TaxID=181874 RepID=A0A409W2V2_9AGAR|nr:hypothetical protein CVT24_001182 [Panaeolus cyanescens]